MVRKFTTIALVALAAALSAASASAAVRTASVTFNPNNPNPSFNPPPQHPLVSITTSYDDTGTISVTVNGAQLNDGGNVSLYGTSEADTDWMYNYCDSSSVPSPCWYGSLGLVGVGGILSPTLTPNPDGSETETFSNPFLANQDYRFIKVSFGGSVTMYFPGYEPKVTVANPGTQSARVGTPVSFFMDASEHGLAMTDHGCTTTGVYGSGSGNLDGVPIQVCDGITSITAVNLPPGLKMDRTGRIYGTPTQAGTGTSTVTAVGAYNNGSQSTSASVTFAWTVTNPPPPAPVISTWVAAPQTVAQLTRIANAHHVIGFSSRSMYLRPVRVTNAGRKNGIDKWSWATIKSRNPKRVGQGGILFKHQRGKWMIVAGGAEPSNCPQAVFKAFQRKH